MCLDALTKQLNFDFITAAANDVGNTARNLVLQAGRLTKDGYAIDITLRTVSETLKLIDLQAKTEAVARPTLAVIAATRGFIDATRIVKSLNHLFSGGLYNEVVTGKVVPALTEVALFVGRAISTLHWCVEQKLFSFDDLAKKAASIGGHAGAVVDAVRKTHVMNGAFIVGLAGLIYQDVEAIQSGEQVASHTLAIVSYTADIASIALGFANMANPHVVTTLAVVAGATAVASWLADPSNK